MDGKARISCQLTPERANGSTIQTLEGLDSKEIDEMVQAGIVGPFTGSKAREVLVDDGFLDSLN